MEKFSPELRTFLNLLDKKEKMTAMLAPSFPIDFSYPKIVGKLKRLGFTYIVEVARGAMETNRQLLKAVIKNPHRRFITTPCPVIVRLIRNKYPELKSYLAPALPCLPAGGRQAGDRRVWRITPYTVLCHLAPLLLVHSPTPTYID